MKKSELDGICMGIAVVTVVAAGMAWGAAWVAHKEVREWERAAVIDKAKWKEMCNEKAGDKNIQARDVIAAAKAWGAARDAAKAARDAALVKALDRALKGKNEHF